MKQFKFYFAIYNPYNSMDVLFMETIESDDIVELFSKLPLTLAKGIRKLDETKEHERKRISHSITDDDIPF